MRGNWGKRPRVSPWVCKRGHVVEGDNLFVDKRGYQDCLRCRRIRHRTPVAPEEGVVCLICGDILRALGTHIRVHGVTNAEYRKRFPGAPFTGSIVEGIRLDQHIDRVNAGEAVIGTAERQKTCQRGHPMTGKNVMRYADGGRRCRTCFNAGQRRYRTRQKEK